MTTTALLDKTNYKLDGFNYIYKSAFLPPNTFKHLALSRK